jgi:glycerophosphoryl diester phosphodiesterase
MEPRRSIRSIAHQGYAPAGQSKNNLAEGYILAASVGFNYGECDLVFSSDKVPFCCHPTKIGDNWVNAFYDPVNEEYVYFAENTAAQILSHAFIDADHTVSTFKEVVAACKSVGMGLYVDKIDNIADDDEWETVFNIIKYYAMMDKMVFLATDGTQANKILSLYPNAEISFLTSLNAGAIARSNALKTANNRISMDVNGSTLTESDIKTAYNQLVPGVTIEVYTINDLEKYKELMPYVIGITSDSIAEPML